MKVIRIRNVHRALPEAIRAMESALDHGDAVLRESRAGHVYQMKDPVTTLYLHPRERVLFWPERDANPFFHFMEGLWMLAGRNDVGWISQFNKSFVQFSDNGRTFHGAYGKRWREWFNTYDNDGDRTIILDQLAIIAEILKENPDDRRCVLQMWDAPADLGLSGKDFPCNLAAMFAISPEGELNMTVTNRSNDIIWGAYGANAVHFSMLQEVMAAWIGVPVGQYWQVSNNWHAYRKTFDPLLKLSDKSDDGYGGAARHDPYAQHDVTFYPMVNGDIRVWFEDLLMFIEEGPIVGFRDIFFRRVATPIFWAWKAKENSSDPERFDKAIEILQQCAAPDWKRACIEWIERRRDKAQGKTDV